MDKGIRIGGCGVSEKRAEAEVSRGGPGEGVAEDGEAIPFGEGREGAWRRKYEFIAFVLGSRKQRGGGGIRAICI